MQEAVHNTHGTQHQTPEQLGRADVRRCGTLWMAHLRAGGETRPARDDVLLRVVQPDDLDAVRQAMIAVQADHPELAAVRIHGGRLGYIAVDPQTQAVLSYGWVARHGDHVDDLGFPLAMPPGEVWIYDCATVPAARGRQLYPAILRLMRADLAQQGISHAWIGTAPRNWASQRGIAHAGFHKIADADWTSVQAVLHGVPGVPGSLLTTIADATGDIGAEVRPDAGIPWIEATLEQAGAQDKSFDFAALPDGLRRFRTLYSDELHWTISSASTATPEEALPQVTLCVDGSKRTVRGRQPFEAYDTALAELAPNLPVLG